MSLYLAFGQLDSKDGFLVDLVEGTLPGTFPLVQQNHLEETLRHGT